MSQQARRYFFYFVCLLYGCTPERIVSYCMNDSLEICPHVGYSIDQYERKYFSLFPDIQDYTSAILLKRDARTFVLSVSLDGGKKGNQEFVLSIPEYAQLYSYIEHYEELMMEYFPSEVFAAYEQRFTKLHDQRNLVLPKHHVQRPLHVLLKSVSARTYNGYLLYIDDSLAVIGMDDSFTYTHDSKEYRFIRTGKLASIDKIEAGNAAIGAGVGGAAGIAMGFILMLSGLGGDEPGSLFGLTGLLGFTGAVVGILSSFTLRTTDTIYQEETPSISKLSLQVLKTYSMFPDLPPPELEKVLSRKR